MTKYREIIRLTGLGFSQRDIMASCDVAQKNVVKIQHHISVDGMLYSAPYEYNKKKGDVKVTDTTIEIFYNHNRIASHRRLKGRTGQYRTITEHMPKDRQKNLEWSGDASVNELSGLA